MATLAAPIGVDNFSELLNPVNNYLFVDKTLMIADIIDSKQKIELILRPRRWGKSLNMSMLQYFFAAQVFGKSTQGVFDNLKIAREGGETYMQHQGQYPVLSVSFKDIKASNFEQVLSHMVLLLQDIYTAYAAQIDTTRLSKGNAELFCRLANGNSSQTDLEHSIKFLSQILHQQTDTPVYILIDEYDSPLTHAYQHGYFNEMVELMRNLFSLAFKGNFALKKGVITGILRLAKENLFSGVNNLKTHSLLDKPYSAYYGFTEQETLELLVLSHLEDKAETVKTWYNGYRFGEYTLYNPWSIVNCIDDEGAMKPYWVNTAGHDLIRQALTKPNEDIRDAFSQLLQGESIQAYLYDRITYLDLTNSDKLWSLLLFAGYLNAIDTTLDEISATYKATLMIPNHEVLTIYRGIFVHWLRKGWGNHAYQAFITHLTQGNVAKFIQQLNDYLMQSNSYHDSARFGEAFYHGFVLGLVASIRDTHMVRSNRESGLGRYDVMIIPKANTSNALGILLEFKFTDTKSDDAQLSQLAQEALAQISQQQYITELQTHTQVHKILCLGLAFSPKQVVGVAHHEDLPLA